MKSGITTLTALLCAVVLSTPAHASWNDWCRESKQITQKLPLAGVSLVKLNALAGNLEVSDHDSADLNFDGRACSSDKDMLKEIDLEVNRDGDVLELTVIIPYDKYDDEHGSLDVDVHMPKDVKIEIRDSSGNIELTGISATSVNDSSGDIWIRDNQSDLRIRDSSGDISVRASEGELKIQDSSGDIDIANQEGALIIEGDSSGDIDIDGVSQGVIIEHDSSGEIEIVDIKGGVIIERDSSGSIDISKVQGKVDIGSDGAGQIDIADVSQGLSIGRKGSGKIRTRNVDGKMSIPDM